MKILLLGSTGSIGVNVCKCIRRYPDHFEIVGCAVEHNIETLLSQIHEFNLKYVYVGNPLKAEQIKAQLPAGVRLFDGQNGLTDLVCEAEYDLLCNALVGSVGFKPTAAALARGKRVALANKESLVVGGDYIEKILKKRLGDIIPIDSEHSAILQCLNGESPASIESIILTASGGPFRDLPVEQFDAITPAQALKHPTWQMGKKITIDSATLMNKGFEVIEARYLFNVPYENLRVWVHPQSTIHSLVEFFDGAVVAQLGVPDMELPIQYALSWPTRMSLPGKRMNLTQMQALTFFEPDMEKFRCLKLCIEAGKTGGTSLTVLNAANEVAVNLFLNGIIKFPDIARIIEDSLERHSSQPADSIERIDSVDSDTRNIIERTYHIERCAS